MTIDAPASATTLVVTDKLIAELAAIGAAIGANCEPCLTFHYGAARKLGLTPAELTVAVKTAQAVKSVPAARVLDAAAALLEVESADLGGGARSAEDAAAAAGCGGGEPAAEPEVAEQASASTCC